MSCRGIFWAICVLNIVSLLFSPQKVTAISINEFSANAGVEWVEIYNASDSADYLKQYYLDDDTSFTSDSGSGSKKSLAQLQTSNIKYPYFELSTFFNNDGDWVVLFDSAGVIVDQYQYDEDPGSSITIGRSPDGTGSFAILSSSTKGEQNAQVLVPSATPTNTPSPTPTPNPTNTSQPTATITYSPTATIKLTNARVSAPTQTVVFDILGTSAIASDVGETSDEVVTISTGNTRSANQTHPLALAFLFIGIGLALLSFAMAIGKIDAWKNLQKSSFGHR